MAVGDAELRSRMQNEKQRRCMWGRSIVELVAMIGVAVLCSVE